MENKRRKIEMDENQELNKINRILQNQEELHHLVYQIGHISENSQTLINMINSKIDILETQTQTINKKIKSLENTIEKMNHTFLKELHQKNDIIKSLEELNQNIEKEYQFKIEMLENNSKKSSSSTPSYYN